MADTPTVGREGFLDAAQKYASPTTLHEIPELKVTLKLRRLSKRDQMDIRRESVDKRGNLKDFDRFEVLLFLAGVVEPKLEESDMEVMFSLDAGIFDRVVRHIADISGIDVGQETIESRFPDLAEEDPGGPEAN